MRYAWSRPNPFFLPALAQATPLFIYMPAHYLKPFHEKYAEAEPLMREALEICEAAGEDLLAYTEVTRASLGACLFGLGRTAEAERLVAESLRVLEQGPEIPRTVRFNMSWTVKQLEAVNQPELAARFDALLK